MREVGWVVFDEIHYMRDPGIYVVSTNRGLGPHILVGLCVPDKVAEWLRRWTANPLCSARMGSNPILVVFL